MLGSSTIGVFRGQGTQVDVEARVDSRRLLRSDFIKINLSLQLKPDPAKALYRWLKCRAYGRDAIT